MVLKTGNSEIDPRPVHWAKPFEFDGLPNFFKVTDDLYRGAQPNAEGMHQLKILGIKTVINLRTFHSNKGQSEDTGLDYEHIRLKAWHPSKEDIVRFLQIVTDRARTPIFIHCRHGADRTGVMCAIYRISICGWTKLEAVREMTMGGFGYHKFWTNLTGFIEGLDISAIIKEAGIQDLIYK